MTDWIYKNEKDFKKYPLIFHDFYFHNKVLNFDLYTEIDELYASFLLSLINTLKEQKLLDNLIILSDHGPRIHEHNDKVRINKKTIELNESGFFIYYFALKEVDENYKNAMDKKLK